MPPKKSPSRTLSTNNTSSILSFFKRTASTENHDHEKHDGNGSSADPVVISDGEDEPVSKRRKVSAPTFTPRKLSNATAGKDGSGDCDIQAVERPAPPLRSLPTNTQRVSQPPDPPDLGRQAPLNGVQPLEIVEPNGEVWEEPDEGMGMGEEGGEAEDSDDHEPDSEGDSDEIACMVCGKSLPQAEAETHINACLDAQPAAKLLPEKRKTDPKRDRDIGAKTNGDAKSKRAGDKPPPVDDDFVIVESQPKTNGKSENTSAQKRKSPNGEARSQPITSISHSIARSPSPPGTGPVPDGKGGKGANAFSLLMSGHKEKELWADVDEPKRIKNRRAAPFYKVLTGMPIAVDAFCYGAVPGVNAYFLTHAHSDHYTNLSKSWKHGPIYCSYTTANLIILKLGVEPQWVHGLPDDEEFEIPNTGGVKVTLLDANHCPGSSLFLFEGLQTANAGDSSFRSPFVGSKRVFRYLHCGDFRACPKHILHPAVAGGKLDTVYLDTTYLNPQYCFPPQPLVIRACAELARKIACEDESVKVEPKVDLESMDEEDLVDPPREEDVGDFEDDKFDPDMPVKGVCLGLQDDGIDGAIPENPEAHMPEEEDVKPDIKPDIETTVKHEAPEPVLRLPPGVSLIDTKVEGVDAKPDITQYLDSKSDLKPDLKPHPSTLAYEAQERSVAMMSTWLKKDPSTAEPKIRGRVLVMIGTYSIGKERIVKAVAQALGTKIYCDARKRRILLAQDDPELHALLSEDPKESQVHLVPLGHIQLDHLQPYLDALKPHFTRVLGFRPTGWTYRPPAGANTIPDVNFVIKRDQSQGFSDVSLKPIRGSSRVHMMFGVPYSEHSSFFELTCFSLSTPGDPRIIATVNVHSEKSRAKMRKWFEKWGAEKIKRRAKGLGMVEYRDETYW